MDALSELIRVAGLRASLDLRCRFAEGVAIDHEQAPAREIVFHLVLQGGYALDRPDAAPIEMHPGHFVALPARTLHQVRSLDKTDAMRHPALDLLCGRIAYQSSAIDPLFASLPDVLSVSQGDADSRAELHRIVTQIRAEVAGEQPGAAAIVAALCVALFALALRVNSARDTTAPGMLRLIGDERLARAARAILQEPGRDWTLAQLADQATMSRPTFARRFRNVASMTPGDFLLRMRMWRAAELLESTRSVCSDIGATVGYRSEAAFVRAFKRVVGAPPAAYRRGLRAARRR